MSNIYLTSQPNKDTKYNARLHSFSQHSDRHEERELSSYRSQLICEVFCLFADKMGMF